MDSIKNYFTNYTVNNYDSLENKTLVKFKGRKSSKISTSTDFDPNNYVILHKYNNNYFAVVNDNYKLLFDQNFTLIVYIKLNKEILFDKNEDFTVEKFN